MTDGKTDTTLVELEASPDASKSPPTPQQNGNTTSLGMEKSISEQISIHPTILTTMDDNQSDGVELRNVRNNSIDEETNLLIDPYNSALNKQADEFHSTIITDDRRDHAKIIGINSNDSPYRIFGTESPSRNFITSPNEASISRSRSFCYPDDQELEHYRAIKSPDPISFIQRARNNLQSPLSQYGVSIEQADLPSPCIKRNNPFRKLMSITLSPEDLLDKVYGNSPLLVDIQHFQTSERNNASQHNGGIICILYYAMQWSLYLFILLNM